MAWNDAPSKESTKDPVNPARVIIKTPLSQMIIGKTRVVIEAMKTDPASAEREPISVTPPDVPASTVFQEVIRRGFMGLSEPSSVAQVSAVTAAMAPA